MSPERPVLAVDTSNDDDRLLANFLSAPNRNTSLDVTLGRNLRVSTADLHILGAEFRKNGYHTLDLFLGYIKSVTSKSTFVNAEKMTRGQHTCFLWKSLRYGRITASVVHSVYTCKTGVLGIANRILGSTRPFDTVAMKRGRRLKQDVVKVAEQEIGEKINKCGLFIKQDSPIFAASPDGIGSNFVVEIKCPFTTRTAKTYIVRGNVAKKFYSQVQWQMFICNKPKAYFIVADPNFETNKKVSIKIVEYNNEYAMDLFNRAFEFY